jgi:hypothetical protein
MGFFFAQVAYFLILDVVWCGVVWCGLWFLWFLRGYPTCAEKCTARNPKPSLCHASTVNCAFHQKISATTLRKESAQTTMTP